MELEDGNIHKFWQWFVKSEKVIKECIENENARQREFVVDQMNEQILGLGVFTWDIGLNEDERWFLTLSSNGNPDMLELSQEIMAVAPKHMDWLFYAGKPARKWNRQFTIYDDYMDEQFIDASQWHFLIFEDEDGMIELVIEAKNLPHLDPETAESAAEQFVVHEIGERTRILYISSIVIVPGLESEDESSKIPVAELKEHLGGMI